jgi:hypothetical protein
MERKKKPTEGENEPPQHSQHQQQQQQQKLQVNTHVRL